MFLPSRFSTPNQPVLLYGTTPPHKGTAREEVVKAAEKLVARTQALALDGLIVYDVQDESERTSQPRPFPFLPTLDSRVYAQLLRELSGRIVVTYKCVSGLTENEWAAWLTESAEDFGVRALSLVGSATRRTDGSVSLARATEMAATHSAQFDLGAVAIAERHTALRSESRRMIQKASIGCEFFVSQSVYDAKKSITLLNDYARDCREAGLAPRRFIFTFAPCGREKTLQFIKWLGVSVPDDIQRSILGAADPLGRSLEICRSILAQILEGLEDKTLPLGLNIESVSHRTEELDASLELFRVLEADLRSYCRGVALADEPSHASRSNGLV